MPLYEYVCPKCGQSFEKLVSFASADRPQSCPSCGHDKAAKQISRVAAHAFASGSSAGSSAAASCSPSFG